MSDYGIRAADALNQLLPGEHRDKTVARLFDCSVRMAKYLRAGQHWTAERLSQASSLFGSMFDEMLVSGPELHRRMDALETEIAELRRSIKNGEPGAGYTTGAGGFAAEGGERAGVARSEASPVVKRAGRTAR